MKSKSHLKTRSFIYTYTCLTAQGNPSGDAVGTVRRFAENCLDDWSNSPAEDTYHRLCSSLQNAKSGYNYRKLRENKKDRVNLDSDLMCLSLDISVVVVGGLLLASGLF
jgi:hypothetical protein